jgi:hypothetical protein
VLGVGHGWKETKGKRTKEYGIIVYVREKNPLRQLSVRERIPTRVGGVRTDVVVVGTHRDRPADEREHRFLDYAKIHQEHRRAIGRRRAISTANDRDIGNVAVVEDDPNQSFILTDRKDVDWVGAYRKFRLTHPDIYHFVTFWSDVTFEIDCDCGAFYCGLVNPARGINWSACIPGGRRGWGTRRLQAFMYFIREDDAALLQEIGHHWMAYTGFKDERTHRTVSYEICLDNEPGHWSSYFDDDRSPMDYDELVLRLPGGVSVDWVDNGDGTFTPRQVGQGEYAYAHLDLYLMGLIPPEDVGEFYLIRNPRRQGNLIRGTPKMLTIEKIIWANGRRSPTVVRSPKRFKNAFVLLTRDANQAEARAHHIDQIRERFTRIFREATGGRAEVDTTLAG